MKGFESRVTRLCVARVGHLQDAWGGSWFVCFIV